jgi:hypothetical protein
MTEQAQPKEKSTRRYETADVEVRSLLLPAGGIAALLLLGVLASVGVFHYFVTHQSLGPQASPFENVRTLPPEPQLQVQAPSHLKEYQASEDYILHGYGWIDSQAGIVRIPIERAMDLLVQKGLPVRGGTKEKVITARSFRQRADASGPGRAPSAADGNGNR